MVNIRTVYSGLGGTKSAYRTRRDGDYPRIERLLRSCKSAKALDTVWTIEKAVIEQWPQGWLRSITEEHARLKVLLDEGGKDDGG